MSAPPNGPNLFTIMAAVRAIKAMLAASRNLTTTAETNSTTTAEASATTTEASRTTTTNKEHAPKANIAMPKSRGPGRKSHLFAPEEEACLYFLSKTDLFCIEIFTRFKECYPNSAQILSQVNLKTRTLRHKKGKEADTLLALARQQTWWEELNLKLLPQSPGQIPVRLPIPPAPSEDEEQILRIKQMAEAKARYHASSGYKMLEKKRTERRRQERVERRMKSRATSVVNTHGLSSPLANLQISSPSSEMKTREEEASETMVAMAMSGGHFNPPVRCKLKTSWPGRGLSAFELSSILELISVLRAESYLKTK